MLRGHPGLPRPPASVQPASPQCPGEKGQVAPAEAPIILSSPRTSKTDSYELVWRPRHEGGSRAPILYYEVKHRKVGCLALCPPPLRLGGGLCSLPPLELPPQPGLPTPLLVTTSRLLQGAFLPPPGRGWCWAFGTLRDPGKRRAFASGSGLHPQASQKLPPPASSPEGATVSLLTSPALPFSLCHLLLMLVCF